MARARTAGAAPRRRRGAAIGASAGDEFAVEIGERLDDTGGRARPAARGRPARRARSARHDAVAALHPHAAPRSRSGTRRCTRRGRARSPLRPPGLHLTPGLLQRLPGQAHRRPHRRARRRPRHVPARRRRSPRRSRDPSRGVPRAVARRSTRAHAARRVVAVGTTSVRALESAALGPLSGDTSLFIHGGFDWQVVDLLMTNFHLPRSSLLLLVDAFIGPRWRALYDLAIGGGLSIPLVRRRDAPRPPRGSLMTGAPIAVEVTARDGGARATTARTPRGEIRTPCFMPVGTRGGREAPRRRRSAGARRAGRARQHLSLDAAPWRGHRSRRSADCTGSWASTATCSPTPAGFQVFSLSPQVDDDGVTFRSVYDGSVAPAHARARGRRSRRHSAPTSRWRSTCARRCRLAPEVVRARDGTHRELGGARQRRASARGTGALRHRAGGRRRRAAQGERPPGDRDRVRWLRHRRALGRRDARRDASRPRGRHRRAAHRPTPLPDGRRRPACRSSRRSRSESTSSTACCRAGSAATAPCSPTVAASTCATPAIALDDSPIDESSPSPVSAHYSRGYVRHLLTTDEPTGRRLLTLHNIGWLLRFVDRMRTSIEQGAFEAFRADVRTTWDRLRLLR